MICPFYLIYFTLQLIDIIFIIFLIPLIISLIFEGYSCMQRHFSCYTDCQDVFQTIFASFEYVEIFLVLGSLA